MDEQVLLGDESDLATDYDGCVISMIHNEWSQFVRKLGVAYGITGDSRYAEAVRRIVGAYAERYLSYELHGVRHDHVYGVARLHPQTLDEAVWVIPVVEGLDLVCETVPEHERTVIADRLLLPITRDVIIPHEMGVHNIQCWKNSAVGLTGFLLDDDELIEDAIDNEERGYWKQMRDGVTPDGTWWEGAWAYHFYTLQAVWPLAIAAENRGTQLECPEFHGLFSAPITFAMPDGTLPAFNDSQDNECEIDLRGL